ncbi:MAG TPA: phosphotransferase family protein [Anaeromyxobacteraceae bacterium]|nr:phosphotransferase family protein [Anaeromyxobacteraceae bacterium]
MTAAMSGERAAPVRPGEGLDVAAVDAWLRSCLPGLRGAPEVTQYAGGASNWTYRLRYENDDLVLRRPPAGTKARSAHDMGREFRVQAALRPVFPYVPELVELCEDPAVLGTGFYVMRRVPGIIPRARFPEGVRIDPATARRLCERFVDVLVALHRVDPAAAGLAALGKGPGYPRRQVEGWIARYEKARTWNVPRFSGVIGWLRDHVPDDVATCVVHNDFRLDNAVLDPSDPTRVVAVLDWEMATVGDPLVDLGNALAYWVQADDDALARATRRQPTHLPGMLTRREVWERYGERTGLRTENAAFYEVQGLFRLAVIAQQIYYRYHHRQTRNPAFKRFWALAHYLEWRCARIIRARRRARG